MIKKNSINFKDLNGANKNLFSIEIIFQTLSESK